MGNMSYCMFRNTLKDLRECVRRMEDNGPSVVVEDADEDERRAFDSLVGECGRFVESYADLVRKKPANTKGGASK